MCGSQLNSDETTPTVIFLEINLSCFFIYVFIYCWCMLCFCSILISSQAFRKPKRRNWIQFFASNLNFITRQLVIFRNSHLGCKWRTFWEDYSQKLISTNEINRKYAQKWEWLQHVDVTLPKYSLWSCAAWIKWI